MTLPVSEENKPRVETPETETDFERETEKLKKELDALVNGTQPDPPAAGETGRAEDVEDVLLPELRGLEVLKEGTYVVDPEKTISNMMAVVRKMEAQLRNTLTLNADLERDLDDSKEMIIDLRAEKIELENIIKRMEEEIPSKRELQMEIEYLVDERSSAQLKIRDLKQEITKGKEEMDRLRETISDLEEDKKDYRVEADYLVTKLNAVLDADKGLKEEVKKLKRQNQAMIEKIGMLEKELKKADEERYRVYKELSR